VESVAVKVSSKSQKKFAILAIGDGLERYELPVWPEMFEEKAPLLKENQLLYALLQLEKKEGGSLQFSAKAIEDLTILDEAKMKIIDEMYDKLKTQAKAPEPKWKKEKKEKAPMMQEEVKHLVIKLDADRLRHSQILALKELLREYPGKSTLELQFLSGSRRVGRLSIDAQWGVKPEPAFLEKLRAFDFIESCT
jgi:DNA polymerase-3 subunit alpha